MQNFQSRFCILLLFKCAKEELEKRNLRFDPKPIPNFHNEFAVKMFDIGKALSSRRVGTMTSGMGWDFWGCAGPGVGLDGPCGSLPAWDIP